MKPDHRARSKRVAPGNADAEKDQADDGEPRQHVLAHRSSRSTLTGPNVTSPTRPLRYMLERL